MKRTVRKDLAEIESFSHLIGTALEDFAGREIEVVKITSGHYRYKAEGWFWLEEWFEPEGVPRLTKEQQEIVDEMVSSIVGLGSRGRSTKMPSQITKDFDAIRYKEGDR